MPTIFVLDHPVKEDACHRYGAAREEWIIIHPVADFNTSRGVDVAGEEGKNVIL